MVGIEMKRRRKDGTLIEVAATFSLIMDDKGKPTALALIERDVSGRKEMEAAIHESEHRFRSLANQAPVLIWTGASDGRMDFVNHEFIAFTGLSERKMLKRPWIELLHPDDVQHGRAVSLSEASPQVRRELTARLCTVGGDYRWVKITVGFHGNGRIVGSMVDVDAQVDAERRMREANRRKDEFLAMLGHELRNPLVPIRNAAEILNQLGGADPRLGWARDTLVRQVEHVTRLVDDLLDISMITRGNMRLHLEALDLCHVARRACESMKELMISRVFELFVQDARSLDRSQGGLGIGLALVRHLVELHGGDIHASSSGGGTGSRMTLHLPLLPKSSIPGSPQRNDDAAPGKGRVLVVDDDVDAGESMVILLGMYGYRVERAVDLPGTLDAARRLRPQVVIMDLALPKADGFEIADRLRALPELGSDVSYISLSGFGQPGDFQRSQEAGFVCHLVKPMNPAELNRLLKGLLEDKDEQEA